MENFWQCAHAKYQTSPRSYSLPKQELWLLGNTLISTKSTPPTGRQSLSHEEDSRNDSAPNERKFHTTVRVQQKPVCWLVFALHLFSPSGVPVLKGESRVRLITVFLLKVCEYIVSERFRFLKYCDEIMVRSWTQLNPADRPMLNTVSCVKSFVFNMPVTLMRCSYLSTQICSATKAYYICNSKAFIGLRVTCERKWHWNVRLTFSKSLAPERKPVAGRIFESRFCKKKCFFLDTVLL